MSHTVYVDVCEQFSRCVAVLQSHRPAKSLFYTRADVTVPQLPCAPSNTQETRPIDNDLQLKARVNFDDIFSENWTLILTEPLLDVYFSNMINVVSYWLCKLLGNKEFEICMSVCPDVVPSLREN